MADFTALQYTALPALQQHTSLALPALQQHTSLALPALQQHTSLVTALPALQQHTSLALPALQQHTSLVTALPAVQQHTSLALPALQQQHTSLVPIKHKFHVKRSKIQSHIQLFRPISQCSLVGDDQRFVWVCCLHLQTKFTLCIATKLRYLCTKQQGIRTHNKLRNVLDCAVADLCNKVS